MGTLTDHQIDPSWVLPFNRSQLQPVSYECLLSPNFLYAPGGTESLDPLQETSGIWHGLTADRYVLGRGQFVLGSTVERVSIPKDVVAMVHGKSSIGRCGMTCHVTAGLIDPNWDGMITLELCNLGPRPVVLTAGMPICQLTFERLDSEVEREYGHPELGSHYQGQLTVAPAAPIDKPATPN